MKYYDIIIIGAGSGGLNIAAFTNEIGLKTLLIDKSNNTIGGDCLNTGCVPSKAFIHAAKSIHEARKSEKFGVKVSGIPDIKKVMQHVHDSIEHIRKHENASYFKKLGMDVELGIASFVDEKTVQVNKKKFTAKRIVIATGSRARPLQAKGVEKISYLTNENLFELDKLPQKLLIVGGGPIGVEMAQAFARLGSQVTILERNERILPREREDTVHILESQLKEQGVAILPKTEIEEFISDRKVKIRISKNTTKTLEFDNVLVSIGRILNIQSLNLENARIKVEQGKIVADDKLRTTNKRVFVVGDVAGNVQFTHGAELHSRVILNNFFSPIKKRLKFNTFSWVTYTDPEIATFGLTEKDLKEQHKDYHEHSIDLSEGVDRGVTDEYPKGKVIMYIGKGKRILGGTIIAPNSGEIMQELVMGLTKKITVDDLVNKIYAYPTASRMNQWFAITYFQEHSPNWVSKMLRWLY